MHKENDYNQPLRSQILICSIREEEAAADAVRYLLRTVRPNSKTLGNKSSSLSFKNKIDLFYDIEDLSVEDYNNLIKFMEIRNQFIHNPSCSSFTDLAKEAPETIKFLQNKFSNKITAAEESYIQSFKDLFMGTLAKLLILKIEYRNGYSEELLRFINAKAIDNFSDIYKAAIQSWKETKQPTQNEFANSEQAIKGFEDYLNYWLLDKKIKIADSIISDEINGEDIFKRRIDLMANFKKEQAELISKNDS